jgi:2-octaprenylphenol hydroxylase
MHTDSNSFDVMIIGGGMVGSATAIMLSQLNLRVSLVERAPVSPNYDRQSIAAARVSAIQQSSERLLSSLGAWDGIKKRHITPFTQMHIQDWQGFSSTLSAQDLHQPNLGYIVENDVITAALWERMSAISSIVTFNAIPQNAHQHQQQWTLQLDNGALLNAPLLIGTDGAHSMVRQWLDIKQDNRNYDQSCIVGTVKTQHPHQQCCWQHYRPEAPFALLPLAHAPNQCSIAWYVTPSEADYWLTQPPEDQAKAMTEASAFMLGELTPLAPLHAFPLIRRQSQHYVTAGAILLGDAAHTVHPQAGQGVNLGFLDVIALRNIFTHAIKHQQSIHDLRVLKRFERARQHDATLVQRGMESLNWLFSDQSLPNAIRHGIAPLAQSSVLRAAISAPTFAGRLTGWVSV